MSRDDAHPALHSALMVGYGKHDSHYVPEGWEDLDRGICPCGEVVRWDAEHEKWKPDRAMRVLVLSPREATYLKQATHRMYQGHADDADMIDRQLDLQDEVELYSASHAEREESHEQLPVLPGAGEPD